MFYDAIGEGVNGCYYNEDFENEYESVHIKKTCGLFVPNPFHYFKPLWGDDGKGNKVACTIEHETSKAMLFKDGCGKFWVPKALLRLNNTLIHTSFSRAYLKR